MIEQSTYEAPAYCCNCAYEGPITAPVGTYVDQQHCPLCRTKMLRPVALQEWNRERGKAT